MSEVIKVSEAQLRFVTNTASGMGLIKCGSVVIPFDNQITIIDLYWSIGEYVSKQIDVNGWGKSTVKALSEYILSKEPGIRGYSSQNIWRMKQFYET